MTIIKCAQAFSRLFAPVSSHLTLSATLIRTSVYFSFPTPFVQVLVSHHDVAEAAVVGIRDAFKGQTPLGLLLLNNNCTLTEEQVCKDVVKVRL